MCLTTRPQNGGLISLEELCKLLSQRSRGSREAVSEDDCLRAISKLKVLGSGFEVIYAGKKKLVRSVPTELNKYHNDILELAQAKGFVSVDEVQKLLSWSIGRATDALETLLEEGLAMIDDGHTDGRCRNHNSDEKDFNTHFPAMLKPFSWSRSTSRYSSAVTRMAYSQYISSFLGHSHSGAGLTDDDPAFAHIPQTLVKPSNKNSKKNQHKQVVEQKSSSKTNNTKQSHPFPVKSDLPFDFRYSYSEINPAVKPIGFREPPRFSPFGPGRLDRIWTGTSAPLQEPVDRKKVVQEREAVLGEPLTEEEIGELVEKYRHDDCSRQINLGKGGVTHNMLEDIHNHWKRAECVRIKCLGVPTLDMDNVCYHLEDKSGGQIIYRHLNILLIYRGRNYDPKNRPTIPLMLWMPYAPIYPKLVKPIADGLTFEETKGLRNKGLNSTPIMKLTRNGVYVHVVENVRASFENEEVVRLDCTHAGKSDCKRIGVKLRDLVPCVPILFKDEQIILWRGRRDHDTDMIRYDTI